MRIFEIIEEKIKGIESPVILLEGKRNVLENDKTRLEVFGQKIAERFPQAIFRSGNADGSDLFFIKGVNAVKGSHIQLIIPYAGHKKKNIPLKADVTALNTLNFDKDTHFVSLTKELLSSRSAELIDRYIDEKFIITRSTGKAAYLLRDTIKVVGFDKLSPANVGIFYDDLLKPESGGTGFTMLVCRKLSIPYFKQNLYL